MRRQRLQQAIQELAHSQPVLGGDERRLVKAELEQLVGEMRLPVRIGLVGRHDDSRPRFAKHLRDVAVDWRQALAHVEQQHDDVRLVDGDPGLGFDRAA